MPVHRFSYHYFFLLGTLLLVIILFSFFFQQQHTQQAAVTITQTYSATFSGLHVEGNRLLNVQGQQVVLRGVDRSGTEYMCIGGNNGVFDGPSDGTSIQAMKSWGINAVLIPLNEDCWLGINGANPGGIAYQQAILTYVNLLENDHIYPILAYMWGASGTQQAKGHPAMPDADHAATFWTSVATTFSNDQDVIFRLQEEPHLTEGSSQAAWQCWKNGGTFCNEGFPVVGFQSLVNTVHSTGAKNVLALPGIEWSNDMDQFLSFKPTDPLNNMIAAVDVYPTGNGCGTVSCYDTQYAPVIAQMPLIAGEFGESVNGDICGVTGSNTFMNWMDQHNSGYLAWVWNAWGTDCGNLSLITNYMGVPHSPNGVNYKAHLLSLTGILPANSPSPAINTSPLLPTFSPVPDISPTIPQQSNAVTFALILCPHGLGNCGDSVSPGGGNTHPQHSQRNVTLTVYDTNNKAIAKQQGYVFYDKNAQNFQGSILAPHLPSGQYYVTVKMDGFLSKQLPGTVSLTLGQQITLPEVALVAGDINNDDQIDILDYNILISCYGSAVNTSSCPATFRPSTLSPRVDINDDNGQVDGGDYNEFLREVSAQKGG
ncbi:MAG TPA: cellulase family glycosylhydrolase [Patescibacteria group bacterium]|nr:cellulase family glycosylhydrolase [Patescibacteria group bacterium]